MDELVPVLEVDAQQEHGADGTRNYNRRALPRLFSVLVVVFLLGGTAAAFAVTQGLKLEQSPVLSPQIDEDLLAGLRVRQRRRRWSASSCARATARRSRSSTRTARSCGRSSADGRFGPVQLEAGWDGKDDARPRRARRRLPAARAPRRRAPDDRLPERDARRHRAAADRALLRLAPGHLAGRRRPRRRRVRLLSAERAGSRPAARERQAACPQARPGADRGGPVVRQVRAAVRAARLVPARRSSRSTTPGIAPSACPRAGSRALPRARPRRIRVRAGTRFGVRVRTDARTRDHGRARQRRFDAGQRSQGLPRELAGAQGLRCRVQLSVAGQLRLLQPGTKPGKSASDILGGGWPQTSSRSRIRG